MYDINTREVQEAIAAADVALDHLERARKCLSSASGWGLFDTLGGGFISGLIKHSRMEDAEREIGLAKRALEKFSNELRDIKGYSSVSNTRRTYEKENSQWCIFAIAISNFNSKYALYELGNTPILTDNVL